jgi:hypothetical protein
MPTFRLSANRSEIRFVMKKHQNRDLRGKFRMYESFWH